jgi:7-cyano-7-deazaguanine synthase in queuosine biosynthesis
MTGAPARHVVRFRDDRDGQDGAVQWGSDLVVDGLRFRGLLSESIASDATDLLIFAASLYGVDRMVQRPHGRATRDSGDWSRALSVTVPVLSPDQWTACAGDLQRLLRWLTDDNWQISFSQRQPGLGPMDQSQGVLFGIAPSAVRPILFSGGLDSACALYRALAVDDVLTMSVHTNTWMQSTQDAVSEGAGALSTHRLTRLSFRACLPATGTESSQRTRGLLFLASGAMAALAAGADGLVVAENGIGAINLPYVRTQHGAEATRSMHPKTLRMFGEFVSKLTGRRFQIEAPYMGYTKAELVGLTGAEADKMLSQTVSCDKGFSARVVNRMPCGACTSCILRRQALDAAGRPDIDSRLQYRTADPTGTPAFAAMAWQALRLRRCLASPDPWDALLREFPDLVHVIGVVDQDEVVRLYDQYANEFGRYLPALGVGSVWVPDSEGS